MLDLYLNKMLSKKYKTFDITKYYKGVEIRLICVTTSVKKFSEISDISTHHIKNYAHSYDLRYDLCNQNPDKLFVRCGMGLSSYKVFDKDKIYTYEEAIKMIDNYKNNNN